MSSRKNGLVPLLGSLDPLKGYFNQGSDKLRFIALLSPT